MAQSCTHVLSATPCGDTPVCAECKLYCRFCHTTAKSKGLMAFFHDFVEPETGAEVGNK